MITAVSESKRKEGKSSMLNPMFFADLISELEKHGMKRQEIANALGVKGPVVSQWKRGSAFPDDRRLSALASLATKIDKRYDAEYLKTYKWSLWIKREKGIDIFSAAQIAYPAIFSNLTVPSPH